LTVDTKFQGLSKSKSPSKDSPAVDPSFSSLGKSSNEKEPPNSASKVVMLRPLSSNKKQRLDTLQPRHT